MPRPKSRLLPIHFPVLRGDEPANATLDFASHADVISAAHWRVPGGLQRDPAMRLRASDSREFALLAAKRWRHYRDTGCSARSLEELRRLIFRDPQGEYCFHLKVTADWFPASLGGAMIRRTWCHHLIIDFLFVHPRICSRLEPVSGVGVQILQAICVVAKALRCKRVWGEATRDSALFYNRQIRRPVEDHFAIEAGEINLMAATLEAKRLNS